MIINVIIKIFYFFIPFLDTQSVGIPFFFFPRPPPAVVPQAEISRVLPDSSAGPSPSGAENIVQISGRPCPELLPKSYYPRRDMTRGGTRCDDTVLHAWPAALWDSWLAGYIYIYMYRLPQPDPDSITWQGTIEREDRQSCSCDKGEGECSQLALRWTGHRLVSSYFFFPADFSNWFDMWLCVWFFDCRMFFFPGRW